MAMGTIGLVRRRPETEFSEMLLSQKLNRFSWHLNQ
jgi:hypothetical protein